MKKRQQYIITGSVLIVIILFILFDPFSRPPDDAMQRIKEDGKLMIITDNNANTYYNYRGQSMGFEYELTKTFADHLGVELEIKTPGWDDMIDDLYDGDADLIAAGLTVTDHRLQEVCFSDCYMTVQQRVVVHKTNHSIRSIQDLDGQSIHVRSGTSYQTRLNELNQNGLNIEIITHNNVPTEELIRQVAEEEIDILIVDSNIALLNRRYYPDIKIAFPIEEEQCLGWAVRHGDDRLLAEINSFFEEIRNNGTFGKIYEDYYANVEIFDYVDLKKFHQRLETRLPKYQELIKQESLQHGFDWRMIAAIIYQESHFNPRARSHTGVRGLMQITLNTAREMGIKNRLDPEQSVRAGVSYLAKLYRRFDEIENQDERLLFALASYNVGYGHVRDAQQICRQLGWDQRKWADLKRALPLLRQREYYKNTRYGYARGSEPVRYIERILTYFDIIKREAIR